MRLPVEQLEDSEYVKMCTIVISRTSIRSGKSHTRPGRTGTRCNICKSRGLFEDGPVRLPQDFRRTGPAILPGDISSSLETNVGPRTWILESVAQFLGRISPISGLFNPKLFRQSPSSTQSSADP